MNKFLIIHLTLFLSLACNRNRISTGTENNIVSLTPNNSKSEKKETNSESEKISFQAKIIRILDGDTVEILYDKLPIKLRLEHIDAPEKRGKQPYGNAAKITLSDLCYGQMATINYQLFCLPLNAP